jgi:Flp pilus assembly protein TadD
LALKPDDAEAHNNLGAVYFRRGRFEEASASFEKAASLDPGLAGARHNLARILAAAGNFPRALGEAEAALALDPTSKEFRRTRDMIASDMKAPQNPLSARPNKNKIKKP